ncbi:amidohydrolase [Occultella gossypii]|uniref:Amidohydrolase n=1 Tax=Occultella gossypii TaxID=2800820 RepID=A0ABS7S759_9MICO|nr:amidohydrolase [Occultella gossypii]MBZ2195023.1 amidohydrolase [Occultella gossypii]
MSTPAGTATVLAAQPGLREWQEDLYRDLHAHPELSHFEVRTAQKAAALLRADGFEVHDGVGGTGVVGVLRNGDGPVVLVRADMDGLPIAEATGLDYASTAVVTDADGHAVPVMHGCGHDVHVACLAGAARLLAGAREAWRGTLVALYQPAEELGEGAQAMVDDGLAALIPTPDVALGQHVLAYPAGTIGPHAGPFLSLAQSIRITVYGRGAHGSMPHLSVDPAVLVAAIVLRLQGVVAREVTPGEFAVLTVGRMSVGSKSNIIDDRGVLDLNLRAYDGAVRDQLVSAIERIVRAECAASGSPREPEFEAHAGYPLTDNDAEATTRVTEAFRAHFADAVGDYGRQTASEDFSNVPRALGVPYTFWGFGGVDPGVARTAAERGEPVPSNHSPMFAPAIRPTLETGTAAVVVAALAWLGVDGGFGSVV